MKKMHIKPTTHSPEICFSPEENKFFIHGTSAPEDVRGLYYPVIEWLRIFIDEVSKGKYPAFSEDNPVRFQIDLEYFNSSSAKFLYDIFFGLKKLGALNVPVVVEWKYEEEDIDMKEAGEDIALLAEMEFTYIPKRMRQLRGQQELYDLLDVLSIRFEYHEHPPLATIEEAKIHWKDYNSDRCKNIFFRNHKGDRHYLVILEHLRILDIHDLEKRLRQGKLTFASDQRLKKYLGVEPGSVSPFGLINDSDRHVHLFIDEKLAESERLAFHPNVNTASLVISRSDFLKFLGHTGNTYEFIKLYD